MYHEPPYEFILPVVELNIDYCCGNYAAVHSQLNCPRYHLSYLSFFINDFLSYHSYNDRSNVFFVSVATLQVFCKLSFVVSVYKYILNSININYHYDEIIYKFLNFTAKQVQVKCIYSKGSMHYHEKRGNNPSAHRFTDSEFLSVGSAATC